MGDLEHVSNKVIENPVKEDDITNTNTTFTYKFTNETESTVTAIAITYIIAMLVIGSIVFTITAVEKANKYAEIYTLILMLMSLIYISSLSINVYISKKHAKEHGSYDSNNNNNNSDNNHTQYAYLNDSHSDIFYLKIGACIFVLGILLHSSMLIVYEVAFLGSDCECYFSLIYEIFFPLFSLTLLIFIIKFSNIVINQNVIFSRFFVIHCIGTSVTIGLFKIVCEARESLQGSLFFRSTNSNCTGPASLDKLYKNLASYLYPFIIEFFILNAGIFTMIWFRIGKFYNAVSLKSRKELYIDFSGSHRGLLSGFILVAITICFIILSFVMAAEQDYYRWGITIDEIFELVVYMSLSILTIIAFVQTSKLSTNTAHVSRIDNILLFIGVPGVLAQTILCLLPAILNGAPIIICNRFVQTVQIFLQTPFIISRLRSCCNQSDQIRNKPGREYVTFLAIANVSLWIYYAFANHGIETFQITAALYGKTTWKILYYLTLPFVMFYRFHSSVCLAHIWKHAYSKNL